MGGAVASSTLVEVQALVDGSGLAPGDAVTLGLRAEQARPAQQEAGDDQGREERPVVARQAA